MKDLERCLQEAQAQRFRIVVTDGVFSMDGNVAPMDQICDLAEKLRCTGNGGRVTLCRCGRCHRAWRKRVV